METELELFRTATIRLRSLQARKETALKAVDNQFAEDIEVACAATAGAFEKIKLWADANPAEFGKLKSLVLTHGTIGWRAGQPALKTLPGWTFDRVLDVLKARKLIGYLREKWEVNKQTLLADRDAIGVDKLREIGLRVAQDETFFVEPKLEEVPAA
jgi:phage host-nuclease inhibitor protein Gam